MKRPLHTNVKLNFSSRGRHAGVSLTVTSVTDVAAFAIGAVTVFAKHRKYSYIREGTRGPGGGGSEAIAVKAY